MIGTTVSHFRILERLGQGGMGEVFLAQDTNLERPVALKFISEELSGDPLARARLLREARAVAALNHPHICTIFEIGELDGQAFLAMEYLKGATLRTRFGAGPMDPEQAVSIGLQLADALAEAHGKGILHRDLKPENVFLTEKSAVKLLDFGLAKSIDGPAIAAPAAAPDAATEAIPRDRVALPALTETDVMVGTPRYMSPEQVRGEALDPRSDLFSLGAVLYEAATGRPAFSGSRMEAFTSILGETPPPPRLLRPTVPPGLSAVIERLLEKDPAMRFDTAAGVRDALIGSTASTSTKDGAARVHLPSLGVKRSSAHVWIVITGIAMCLTGTYALSLDTSQAGFVRWTPIVAGVVLLLVGLVIGRLSLRSGGRQITARVVRMEAVPQPSRLPSLLWWTAIVYAVPSTLLAGLLAFLWIFDGARLHRIEHEKGVSSHTTVSMIMTCAVVAVLTWALLLRSRGWRKRTTTPWRRTLDLEVEGTFAQVLARCSNALTAVGAHVTGLDLEHGHIEAKTSTTVLNWGEKITFRVQRSAPELCSIALESDCLVPVILTDYGKNAKNLRIIAEALVE